MQGEGERPQSLDVWHLNDEQLETIRDASIIEHAAAFLANAMSCLTDEDGLVQIATHQQLSLHAPHGMRGKGTMN